MKHIVQFLLFCVARSALWFRYRVKLVGYDKITRKTLKNPGGVLFLPNHPTYFVDPVLVALFTYPKFPIRPTIVEYMYYAPVIHSVMKALDALPIPNFSTSSNSLKRKKSDQVIDEVISSIKKGDNFLLYPAGKVKHGNMEVIGGASGIQKIIQDAPEANIVLVRLKGLWGSSFSRAVEGNPSALWTNIFNGIKHCLKNFLFFTPRRDVTIEFVPAPADFPFQGSRLEINRYLEKFYNQPDGLSKQEGSEPGESLVLRPYSIWNNDLLTPIDHKKHEHFLDFNIEEINPEIRKRVIEKLVEITQLPADKISIDMDVSTDLGLDSLDTAELSAFLFEEFSIKGVPVHQITTVGVLMGIAAKKIAVHEEEEPIVNDTANWTRKAKREIVTTPKGDTLIEMFLNTAELHPKESAIADARSGVLTYSQMKMRVVLLAEEFKKLPGSYVGVMLPASSASVIVELALLLAGKTPLMVNWTVGPRHLEQVVQLSNVQVVLSSWAFLDRLGNVDLNGIEHLLVMLEDLARGIPFTRKIKAALRSKKSTSSIMKYFGADRLTGDNTAVLLFTSGTESMPKGVPLSHHNIISNMDSVLRHVSLYNDDVLFCTLPPFHSFGFTIAGLYGPIIGMRSAYSPDPTNGKKLAEAFSHWSGTVMVGAPTFIRGMLRAADKAQMSTMRMCVTGAEKAPPELFAMIEELGLGDVLIEGYGITECSPVLTANKLREPAKGVGVPLAGVELVVVHPETGAPLPQGEQGMILVRGPNVFSGYINTDVKSPFVEHNGAMWYKTGDLGYVDADNALYITGRLKRFIKVGGEMVSLGSIEDAINRYVVLQGLPVSQDGPALAICAKEIPGDKPRITLFTKYGQLTLDGVNKFLKDDGFTNLVKVSAIQQINDIPLMGTGKINYRKLEADMA